MTCIFLLTLSAVLFCSEGDDIFRGGLTHFNEGDYEEAYRSFTRLAEEEPFYYYRANAVFWQGKTLYMKGEYVQAQVLLDQYLINWPDNSYYEEAIYLLGKNAYQQEDYQGALDSFLKFSQEYRNSDYVPHSLYWMAESLYQLGRIEEARQLYDQIIKDYPTSTKAEAARYRFSIIEIKEREEKLLELLKWSHEEFLKTSQDNNQARYIYEEALHSYQEQIAQLADREKDTNYLIRLVQLKEEALELKAFYLRQARGLAK